MLSLEQTLHELEAERETVFGDSEPNELDIVDPRNNFDGNRDVLFAGAGGDLVDASQSVMGGHNRILGGTGADELLASQFDRLLGGAGNDILDASAGVGRNRLYGGEGEDELFAGNDDHLFGGTGDDILDASVGSGNNRLYGEEGNDILIAGNSDRLLGGAGDDSFFITDGGNNLLTGGDGADAFWIASGDLVTSPNTIIDFEPGMDVIGIGGLGANSVEALILTQQGDDTLISLAGFDLALVGDTVVSDLQDGSSFVFAPPDISIPPPPEETPQIQVAEDLFEAIFTDDRESFLALQAPDVDWRVDGGFVPVNLTEIEETDLIPFGGNWSSTEDGSGESVGDFFDALQGSLAISDFEPLDILQDDDVMVARVNFAATVNETGLPFDLDVSFVIDLEDSEAGQNQIESVDMIYHAVRVASAFAGVPQSPELIEQDARDPLTGIPLSVNPNASSEASLAVVEDAYLNNFVVGDLQGWADSFTEDGLVVLPTDPTFLPLIAGPSDLDTFLEGFLNTFGPGPFNVVNIAADGDRVGLVADIEISAVSSGIPIDIRIAHWLTVEDGAISNLQIIADSQFTGTAVAGGEPLFP